MPTVIKITAGSILVEAKLNDSSTARAVAAALPIEGKARRWGEEIYFAIPVKAELEQGAREVIQAGELGYWPTGSAFCMFFGPTPASRADEIRAASAVNIIGTMRGDFSGLTGVKNGELVLIERS
ncbi:MAG: hypothetical protein AMJ79_05905 [Phycisphaerae bacterium SM23_30]|nr:MAG: hypothetical protein AMJ79_05905 [Phycisphaerae bacterium SM23_30]